MLFTYCTRRRCFLRASFALCRFNPLYLRLNIAHNNRIMIIGIRIAVVTAHRSSIADGESLRLSIPWYVTRVYMIKTPLCAPATHSSLFRHTFRDASKQRFVVARRRCCGARVAASKASLSNKLWFVRVHGERRTKAIEVSTVATPAFGIRRSARTGPSASLCVTLMLLSAISDQWTVVVLRTFNRYLEGAISCGDDAHHGTIICSALLSMCTSSTQKQLSLCSSFLFGFHWVYTMQRNATQRNATQRNATQRNATQRNATQRNATQRNATQSNAKQRNATQYNRVTSTYIHFSNYYTFV